MNSAKSKIQITSQLERSVPVVTDYLNYREYLRDFYEYRKSVQPTFSFTVFARKAGIASRDLIRLIIAGKRNLTEGTIFGVAKACGLSSIEERYFLTLVDWNHASTDDARRRLWQELVVLRPGIVRKEMTSEQAQLLCRWFCLAMIEMARLPSFKADAKWISEQLGGVVPLGEIERSLNALRTWNILVDDDGVTKVNDAAIPSAPMKQNAASVQVFHESTVRLALRKLVSKDPAFRNFSSLALAISEKDVEQLKEEIRLFQRRVSSLTAQPGEKQDVVMIQIGAFSLLNSK